jgi:hypothetical protein
MTLVDFTKRLKTHKGIAPGRLHHTIFKLTKSKTISMKFEATPKRAAWLLLCYAANTVSGTPQTFKQWQQEQKAYFDALTEAGEPNPLDFLANILSNPKNYLDIIGVGLFADTMVMTIYRKDLSIRFVNSKVKLPTDTLCNYAFYSYDLLCDIANWLKDYENDCFNLN